jgi:HSP20 family molecular chaperone IbpA
VLILLKGEHGGKETGAVRRDLIADFEVAYSELCRRPHLGRFEPNADVRLSDDERTLVITVEIAGADPEQLRIGLEERELIVLGMREDRERSVRGSVLMKEIAYGPFLKRMHLPLSVRYDDALASYRDGLLVIRLPVAERTYVLTGRTEVKITIQRIIA